MLKSYQTWGCRRAYLASLGVPVSPRHPWWRRSFKANRQITNQTDKLAKETLYLYAITETDTEYLSMKPSIRQSLLNFCRLHGQILLAQRNFTVSKPALRCALLQTDAIDTKKRFWQRTGWGTQFSHMVLFILKRLDQYAPFANIYKQWGICILVESPICH